MPKMKTHRGAAKRFKKTGTGKIIRMHGYTSHMLEKKSPKAKRNLRKSHAKRASSIMPKRCRNTTQQHRWPISWCNCVKATTWWVSWIRKRMTLFCAIPFIRMRVIRPNRSYPCNNELVFIKKLPFQRLSPMKGQFFTRYEFFSLLDASKLYTGGKLVRIHK